MLATGSFAQLLPGLELDGDRVISSDHALRLDRVPASVVVLGGGVIGCEFASVWRSFGAEVTIVEALPRLVAAEDEASSKALERAFRKRGIAFEHGHAVPARGDDRGRRRGDRRGRRRSRPICCWSRSDAGPSPRSSATRSTASRWSAASCSTDERCHTNVDDLGGRRHRPRAAAGPPRVPAGHLRRRGHRRPRRRPPIDEAGIPRVTYSDPEVASVGLTEAQAGERYGDDGRDASPTTSPATARARSSRPRASSSWSADKDGPVVGIHMVGARVGELIGEAQLIYGWEAYPEDVAPLVHAHPTQTEALGEAHLALAGKPLHAHA